MRCRAWILAVLASAVALVGCMSPSGTAAGSGQGQEEDGTYAFANDARLDEHWRKHGLSLAEFNPVLTKEQYAQRANDFFRSEAADILHKERDNGDALRYRPSTNEFGVLSEWGDIRTYFRPDSGMRYWERQ